MDKENCGMINYRLSFLTFIDLVDFNFCSSLVYLFF